MVTFGLDVRVPEFSPRNLKWKTNGMAHGFFKERMTLRSPFTCAPLSLKSVFNWVLLRRRVPRGRTLQALQASFEINYEPLLERVFPRDITALASINTDDI